MQNMLHHTSRAPAAAARSYAAAHPKRPAAAAAAGAGEQPQQAGLTLICLRVECVPVVSVERCAQGQAARQVWVADEVAPKGDGVGSICSAGGATSTTGEREVVSEVAPKGDGVGGICRCAQQGRRAL
jgi:hypothetical protein